MPGSRYMTVRLLEPVIDDIRRLTRRVSAEADRDVTQSEALSAAISYALEHLPEVAARLPETRKETGE